MQKKNLVRFVTWGLVLVAPPYLAAPARSAAAEPPAPSIARAEPIEPIPLHIALDERKILLGGQLFHDPRLSRDDRVACISCHDLARGGVDHLPHSVGIDGAVGEINAPTVFNSGFNFKQFWNGRAETLEEQIDGPLQGPREMGSTWEDVIHKLAQSTEYTRAFADLYPDGITRESVKNALATFERSLYTPNGRFDQYLRGNTDALSAEEQEGYRLFKSYGCVSCHQGVGVGGNMFQVFGVMGDYFGDRGDPTSADLGRFAVTGDELDRNVFKVPSLRNVALTAPYFHDGSAERLEDAVAIMGTYQLGRTLPPEHIELLVKFLDTLTGEYAEGPP